MKFNNRNIHLGKNVKLGQNVKLGDNVTIYDNVEIGKNSIICNDSVIGEPTNEYYHSDNYQNPETVIGENALIRSHAIIYAGNNIGKNLNTGHRVTIREYCKIGNNFAIGTTSDLQGYLEIGDFCRMHSNVNIGQRSKLGNFIFIYPFVVFTNDPHPPSNICIGPTVNDFAQISAGCVLFSGIKVGKHALIGAGSVVNQDVEDYQVFVGTQNKVFGDVRKLISRETRKSHYPWPYNFSRGMPWEGKDFDTWANENNYNS